MGIKGKVKRIVTRKKAVEKKDAKKVTPLEAMFSMRPERGPFDASALKRIQEHLYDGPVEERTEYHNPEFNAIVFLKVLGDAYDCDVAKTVLNAISQCRISLDRKGRAEDVTAIQTEVQRQLEERRLQILQEKAAMGDRR